MPNDFEKLLPEPVSAWVSRGDYLISPGNLEYEMRWEPAFLSASETNRGRYGLDDRARVIDLQSNALAAYIYGFPFPDVDAADPSAAEKIMWNHWHTRAKPAQTIIPVWMAMIDRAAYELLGPERFAQIGVGPIDMDVLAFYYDGRVGGPVPNADGILVKMITRMRGGFAVDGFTRLIWRYLDGRTDQAWHYNPTERRVRREVAIDGSDAFFGQDIAQDDFFVWSGRIGDFTWSIAGEQDVLVPTAATKPSALVKGDDGREWRSDASHPAVTLGYATPGWGGAPWAPTSHVWVKRPSWVLDATPKIHSYRYGRQRLYIDRENAGISYKVIYDRNGRYIRTVHADLSYAWNNEASLRFGLSSFSIAVDELARRACVLAIAGPTSFAYFNTSRADESEFSEAALLAHGI